MSYDNTYFPDLIKKVRGVQKHADLSQQEWTALEDVANTLDRMNAWNLDCLLFEDPEVALCVIFPYKDGSDVLGWMELSDVEEFINWDSLPDSAQTDKPFLNQIWEQIRKRIDIGNEFSEIVKTMDATIERERLHLNDGMDAVFLNAVNRWVGENVNADFLLECVALHCSEQANADLPSN